MTTEHQTPAKTVGETVIEGVRDLQTRVGETRSSLHGGKGGGRSGVLQVLVSSGRLLALPLAFALFFLVGVMAALLDALGPVGMFSLSPTSKVLSGVVWAIVIGAAAASTLDEVTRLFRRRK